MSSETSEPHPSRLVVAGIGASAGGLEALGAFFNHLPDQTGIAFIVIMHLSPDYESHIAELLQKHTTMKVAEATEHMKVEPDHVYIIPPKNQLSIVGNRLLLLNLEKPRIRRAPIDLFFQSLALTHGFNAIGIILSGSGNDGALGLKAIKEQGGFTMVQSIEEAQHTEMPQSAIDTGRVHIIGPVTRLADNLILHKNNAAVLEPIADLEALSKKDDEELGQILKLIHKQTGHDFEYYKKPTILRRLLQRMQLSRISEIHLYYEFLNQHPDEVIALLNDFLISVTSFFRDPEAFEILEKNIIPNLYDRKTADDKVRVWVAGCATGEEAYSVAMLLIEQAAHREDAPEIQIFATDISAGAIDIARNGRYPSSIEMNVSPERLQHHFSKEGEKYRVKKNVRETVLFAVHDLLRDPPFFKVDLIVCRNVLIYLNKRAQQRAGGLFHYALTQFGYLFLGISESFEGKASSFLSIDKSSHIFQRSDDSQATPNLGRSSYRVVENYVAAQKLEKTPLPQNSKIHFTLLERYAPPSLVVNRNLDIYHMSENVGRYLKFSGGKPTVNLLKVVHQGLQNELRMVLHQAFKKGINVESIWKSLEIEGTLYRVRVHVRPGDLGEPKQAFALVIFEEEKPAEADHEKLASGNQGELLSDEVHALTEQLSLELHSAQEQLRVIIEQHEASVEKLMVTNEELLSVNEELKSTIEELETSKEELRSTNEELATFNQENKMKNEELAILNSDLKNLMAATNIGTLFLDHSFRIQWFTPRITDLFNISLQDIGRPLAHFTHTFGPETILDDARQVLETLRPIERELHNVDGKWFTARLLPYHSIDDQVQGLVISFIDITQNVHANQELKKFNKQLELKAIELEAALEQVKNYTSIVSHDLRAPLVNLLGFTNELEAAINTISTFSKPMVQALDEKPRLDVTAALINDIPQALEIIKRSLLRMDHLTKSVLKFARQERLELTLETVNMDLLVGETIDMRTHQIEARGISVRVVKLPEVWADLLAMEQVMSNLIENALLYLDPIRPGEIEIKAIKNDTETLFSVRDNGEGIAEKNLEIIFEPFRRVGVTNVIGEGMGLPYVRKLVHLHGGKVWCESEPGVGSVFYFTIPDQTFTLSPDG